jgi:cellulose biosynthesis protein BcsQ
VTAAHSSGKIITFYSYKGGTGRSMALANVAWILASNGRRVLAVDWDLEAPGLHRYFYPFLVDKELTSSEGVIDFMIDFEYEAITLPEKGATLDKDWYKPHADILRNAASLDWEFPGAGTLDFIPAGQQGDSYSSRVTSFNWQNFYDRLGGGAFLEAMKQRMREEYDYILIDSRTGVSDASGICTVQLPDTLVVCFTMNHQSIEGAAAVATSVYEQRRNVEPSIQILPVPMRIENGEKDKLDRRRQYARQQFDPFPTHIPHKSTDYWGAVEVLYIPYYAYEEILAPFGDKRGQTVSLLASFERLTTYLTQDDPHGEVYRLIAPAEDKRQRVLAEYAREFSEATPTSVEQLQALDEAQVNAAENMFASFTPEQQAIAKRVFSRLVRLAPPEEVGGDTRLRVKKTDLGAGVKQILDDLIYQQLVLLGQDEDTNEETLELVNDALLQKWKRMQDWLAEDNDFLLWRQGLQLGIAKWKDTGRDEAALLRGAFLTEAEHYRATRKEALTDDESAFIAQSTEAESMRREAENELRQKEADARLETVKVRKEKKRLVLKVAAVIFGFVVLTGALSFIFSREKTLVYLGLQPPRYLGEWKDDFLITGDRKPNSSLWVYPSQGQWLIDKGEGGASDDGALLVNGPNLGMNGEANDEGSLKVNWANIGVSNFKGANLKEASLYDFTADFKVRIVKGKQAAWVFRAQSDKQSGYVFVLETGSPYPVINGYVFYGNGKYEALDKDGSHQIMFRGCCKQEDKFRIQAEVKGNEFRFWVTVESNSNVDNGKDGENPSLLRSEDLRDPAGLAFQLKESQDPVSIYLRTRFTEKIKGFLNNYIVSAQLSESERNDLTDELNRLLKGVTFFEEVRFKDMNLSEQVQCLIDEGPKSKNLIRLNRLLLEAAYGEIAKSEERIDTGVEYFIVPFKDERSFFPYGNVGLFEPEAGGQMKVEYLRISAPPMNRLALPPGK